MDKKQLLEECELVKSCIDQFGDKIEIYSGWEDIYYFLYEDGTVEELDEEQVRYLIEDEGGIYWEAYCEDEDDYNDMLIDYD